MKESLVIQSDSNGYAQAEAFVERMCGQLYADNEFGIISMATLQAVSLAIVHANGENSDCQIELECGSCKGGMFFQLTNNANAIDYTYRADMPLDGANQMKYTISRLADAVQMSDDGHCLRLEFNLHGIESPYARQRQHVLQKFHDVHIVEA
ncbi:MAG: hypothetical protein IJR13_08440 [Bacteroidales bacterium]|nr:hypothetical protein [Bacteroidales bacterium]